MSIPRYLNLYLDLSDFSQVEWMGGGEWVVGGGFPLHYLKIYQKLPPHQN